MVRVHVRPFVEGFRISPKTLFFGREPRRALFPKKVPGQPFGTLCLRNSSEQRERFAAVIFLFRLFSPTATVVKRIALDAGGIKRKHRQKKQAPTLPPHIKSRSSPLS